MHESNQDKQIWPPAPTVPMENVQTVPARPYLTSTIGLDVVLGIIAGLTFQWFADYGISIGLFYLTAYCYHLPKPPNCWHLVAASAIALVALLLVWSRLRVVYSTLANSLLWAGLLVGGLLLWFSYILATDVGPNILPR